MYRVYISNVSNDNFRSIILNGLTWINWKEVIKTDSTVFLKPNLTWPIYLPGVVTSPNLLKSLLPILKDRARNVIVGESNLPNFEAEQAFNNLGIDKICRENGAELVNLSKQESAFYKTSVQNKEVKVELPRFLLRDTDVSFSAPVMHTHVVTKVSLSLKNQFGLIPNPKRGQLYHTKLDHVIVAINKLIRTKIALIDALFALNGRGPIFGDPVRMNMTILSNNPVAADTIGCNIMQIPVNKVGHIVLAHKERLGVTDIDKIKMSKEFIAFSREFRVKREFIDLLSLLTFRSQRISNVVFDSSATSCIYKLVKVFRTPKEKSMVLHDARVG